jgi:hypothetical protein
MAYTKSFAKNTSNYPKWEDIRLTDEEERQIEKASREENIELLSECLEDAKTIMRTKNMRAFETTAVTMAIALFEKRASHAVFRKEQRARERFDVHLTSS